MPERTQRDNRQKKSETYYQFSRREKEISAFYLDPAKLKDYVYPSEEQLAFVDSSETLTKENYEKFLEDRIDVIIQNILPCI